MRISLHTLGTRGDVQPFIALAGALRARGHDVLVAAPEPFADLATEREIPFASLPAEFLRLLESPEGRAAVADGDGFSAGFKLLKHIRPMILDLMDAEWRAADRFRPDLIVGHPKASAAPHIAAALGRPFVLASPIPGFTPTRAFASPMFPVRSLGPLNRLSHVLMARSPEMLFGKMTREWKARTLPVARPAARPVATLYAYSRHLLPRPADYGPDVHVTGFWFLDSPAYAPPPDLAAFLAAGPPPVAVGFGSLPGFDPLALTRTVVEALALGERRGVFIGAGGALLDVELPPTVQFIDQAPYDWLFDRVSMTLHHGGAGTTASALRAGKPVVSCPVMGDQPFWARHIHAAGFGPEPLDRRRLTASGIAAALDLADQPNARRRVADAAALLYEEDGVAAAIRVIETVRTG